MSRMDYSSFYASFRPESLQDTVLQGSLKSGLNVCVEVCDRWAVQPDRVALYHRDQDGCASEMTFLQLSQQASRFANYLKSMGIGKGDRVAGLLP